MSRVAFLSDFHAPYHSRSAVTKALNYIKHLSPNVVILGGDLFDLFSFNRFSRRGIATPGDEIRDARKTMEEIVSIIKKYCPRAKIFVMLGNHDMRAVSTAFDKDPSVGALLEYLNVGSLWDFDGAETIKDPRQELIIKGICYMHGYKTAGKHYLHNLMPTVTGHTHSAIIHKYIPIGGKYIWEMNCGYLGDPLSVPLSYPKQKFQHWTHAFGWIDGAHPRIISL